MPSVPWGDLAVTTGELVQIASQRLYVQEAPSRGLATVALRVLFLSYPGEVKGNLMLPI